MIQKQLIKTAWILIFVVGYMTSCDKKEDENKLDIQIDKVIVNDDGEFIFQDSLVYIVNDTLQYQITFETEPKDVDLYYSKNGNDFIKLSEDWITIDSTFKFVRFYAQRQHYNNTDIYRIDFGFGNDSIIPTVILYPNPFVDKINFVFDSKNLRGGYFYKIFDMTGKTILTQNAFVYEDEIEKNIDLSSLSSGVYLVQFVFGNTKLIYKIVKK